MASVVFDVKTIISSAGGLLTIRGDGHMLDGGGTKQKLFVYVSILMVDAPMIVDAQPPLI
jgi:hypothetical protein